MAAQRFIVTGVTGFVGGALARALLARGDQVIGAGRRPVPQLETLGAEFLPLDLTTHTDPHSLASRLQGVDGVFHVAAKVQLWGSEEEFLRVNVRGTEMLLSAARAAGVSRFVYTSSPSVVADGTDLCGVDETRPYPKHYEAAYPRSKSIAERAVLAASDESFWTLALRPHLIFGPGDTNLIPTIVERARKGRLVHIGRHEKLCDFTFIDDCVQAHLRAMESLHRKEARAKAYFISQGDPYSLRQFIDEVVRLAGASPVLRTIPVTLAHVVAMGAEAWASVAGREPFLTRFLVGELSTSHYFNIARARELLGYTPSCTVAEALALTFGAQRECATLSHSSLMKSPSSAEHTVSS